MHRLTAYNLEFHSVPLGAAILMVASPPTTNAAISATISGYLLWVLTEYWMHRHLFHRLYRHAHWVHHLKPRSEDGSPPTLATHLALATLCVALWACLGRYIGAALGSGFLIGYLTYIVPHHYLHRNKWWQGTSMAKRHALHHKGVEVNFNVLCPLGDLLFGTYRKG